MIDVAKVRQFLKLDHTSMLMVSGWKYLDSCHCKGFIGYSKGNAITYHTIGIQITMQS